MIGTLTWNLGTCRNLYLEPLYLEPRNLRNLTWNPYLEPRNLPEPLLGTLTWNLGTCRNLYLEPLLGTSEPSEPYLEPLLGTSEPAGTFTWNPYSEPRNLPEPLLGTLTWNLGARRNLYLEPLLGTSEPAGTFTWNPYLEPRNLPEPLLGTLTWNLGTCRNLAGWLPQSAPGLSLARTPKLSAVGEQKQKTLKTFWEGKKTKSRGVPRLSEQLSSHKGLPVISRFSSDPGWRSQALFTNEKKKEPCQGVQKMLKPPNSTGFWEDVSFFPNFCCSWYPFFWTIATLAYSWSTFGGLGFISLWECEGLGLQCCRCCVVCGGSFFLYLDRLQQQAVNNLQKALAIKHRPSFLSTSLINKVNNTDQTNKQRSKQK